MPAKPRSRSTRGAGRRVSAGEPGTRQRIVDAALAAFAALGFDGATTRDIAERAGANQGLIAYHFSTKEDLWKAAVEQIFGELRQSFAQRAELLDDADAATRAQLMMRHFVRFAAEHPELHRLMVQEGKSDGPRMKWLVDRHVRPLYELAGALMQQARPEAEVSRIAPLHLYYIFVGAAAHLFVMAPECQRLTGVDPTQPQVVRAHADALIDLLFQPPPPSAPNPRRPSSRRKPPR